MEQPKKLHRIAYKRPNDVAEFFRCTAQTNRGMTCNNNTGSIELPDANDKKVARKEKSLELPLL